MADQDINHHTFPNGLTLIAERMEHVRSAALNLLVPGGCAFDPPQHRGLASVFSELIMRGAGPRDSRALANAMDNLGLDRDQSVGSINIRFWGSTLARNLPAALELYADIVRRPHLPEDELPAVQALALQDLQSLEDEPKHKVMVELRRRHFPDPLGQDHLGTADGIQGLTPQIIRQHYERFFHPDGTILAVAGNIDWPSLLEQVDRLFGDWQGTADTRLTLQPKPPGYEHISKETTQTQIALAYPSVPIGHPEYYAAHGAISVLSGGMSARLFTEVREKRGLCYSVWASYQTFKECAAVLCYAGTTNERAQETLDVTLAELRRLQEGVEVEEVDCLRARLKSALIMQQESTSARAGALASDWYFLGRVRSVDEIQSAVNALTPDAIVEHVRHYPPRDLTIVTLGPKPLKPPA
ncbi:MAG: insulinase family protein [Gemmataceae bacterium]|nr:insulinase family protein [Gemmataceae bacterium]MDW8265143.1 pitrilysin family protein [Gemmataceae bacterium]